MLNKFNENWENDILSNIPESVAVIKNELSPLLEEKIKAESVVNNSLDQIDTQGMNDSSLTKEKVKVRAIGARTMNPIMPTKTVSKSDDQSTYNPAIGSTSSFEDVDSSLWRSGYSGALILVGTAILVLLVFMVSFVVFNYYM